MYMYPPMITRNNAKIYQFKIYWGAKIPGTIDREISVSGNFCILSFKAFPIRHLEKEEAEILYGV